MPASAHAMKIRGAHLIVCLALAVQASPPICNRASTGTDRCWSTIITNVNTREARVSEVPTTERLVYSPAIISDHHNAQHEQMVKDLSAAQAGKAQAESQLKAQAESQLKALEAKKTELEKELAASKAQAESQLKELEAKKTELDKELAASKAQAEIQLKELEDKKTELDKELAASKAQLQKQQKQKTDLETDNAQLQKDNAKLRNDNAQLQNDNAQLQKDKAHHQSASDSQNKTNTTNSTDMLLRRVLNEVSRRTDVDLSPINAQISALHMTLEDFLISLEKLLYPEETQSYSCDNSLGNFLQKITYTISTSWVLTNIQLFFIVSWLWIQCPIQTFNMMDCLLYLAVGFVGVSWMVGYDVLQWFFSDCLIHNSYYLQWSLLCLTHFPPTFIIHAVYCDFQIKQSRALITKGKITRYIQLVAVMDAIAVFALKVVGKVQNNVTLLMILIISQLSRHLNLSMFSMLYDHTVREKWLGLKHFFDMDKFWSSEQPQQQPSQQPPQQPPQ